MLESHRILHRYVTREFLKVLCLSLSSLILSVGVYLVFTRLLGVELPAGILPFLG